MTKIDFKKQLKSLYQPSAKEFQVVEVPMMQYLMIDGEGDPSTAQAYQDAIEALYAVAYKLKFLSKDESGKDYVVPPLEGLWWTKGIESWMAGITEEADWLDRFGTIDRNSWQWTSMIMQPEWISQEMFIKALERTREKKDLPALDGLRLESYQEGLSVQILHIGPFAEEGPVLARLHTRFLPQNCLVEAGKHHEIYLSDPRKTAPEKLRTVLRQPVRASA
jgi:hypothetical protein